MVLAASGPLLQQDGGTFQIKVNKRLLPSKMVTLYNFDNLVQRRVRVGGAIRQLQAVHARPGDGAAADERLQRLRPELRRRRAAQVQAAVHQQQGGGQLSVTNLKF